MKEYYVTLTVKYPGEEIETILLETNDLEEAIRRAKDESYYIERDKRKGDVVEIRQYACDIEDEDCSCFDYNTVEF